MPNESPEEDRGDREKRGNKKGLKDAAAQRKLQIIAKYYFYVNKVSMGSN